MDWMEYIHTYEPRDLYFDEVIGQGFFEQIGYDNGYVGMLSAVNDTEEVYGKVDYYIVNPTTVGNEFPVSHVHVAIEEKAITIKQVPKCGNCMGTDVIRLDFYSKQWFERYRYGFRSKY